MTLLGKHASELSKLRDKEKRVSFARQPLPQESSAHTCGGSPAEGSVSLLIKSEEPLSNDHPWNRWLRNGINDLPLFDPSNESEGEERGKANGLDWSREIERESQRESTPACGKLGRATPDPRVDPRVKASLDPINQPSNASKATPNTSAFPSSVSNQRDAGEVPSRRKPEQTRSAPRVAERAETKLQDEASLSQESRNLERRCEEKVDVRAINAQQRERAGDAVLENKGVADEDGSRLSTSDLLNGHSQSISTSQIPLPSEATITQASSSSNEENEEGLIDGHIIAGRLLTRASAVYNLLEDVRQMCNIEDPNWRQECLGNGSFRKELLEAILEYRRVTAQARVLSELRVLGAADSRVVTTELSLIEAQLARIRLHCYVVPEEPIGELDFNSDEPRLMGYDVWNVERGAPADQCMVGANPLSIQADHYNRLRLPSQPTFDGKERLLSAATSLKRPPSPTAWWRVDPPPFSSVRGRPG